MPKRSLRRRPLRAVPSWAVVVLLFARTAEPVTVYRIGGEDMPPPQLEYLYDFVQLSWRDLDETRYGEARAVVVGRNGLAPQRVDPSTNMVPLLRELGGWTRALDGADGWIEIGADETLAFDGDPHTAYVVPVPGRWGYDRQRRLWIGRGSFWAFDLGGTFALDRLRFFTRREYRFERPIKRFLVGFNDGAETEVGSREYVLGSGDDYLDFDILLEVEDNIRDVIEVDLAGRPANRLLFQTLFGQDPWEIAEFEIFGEGYASAAAYASNIIDLGGRRSVGQVQWSGRWDPGARVDVRMRRGATADPFVYWRHTYRGDERTRFGRDRQPLTRRTYAGLEIGERAGTSDDRENWGDWSEPLSGAPETPRGVSPLRYVQFAIDFHSTITAGSRLDYVQFAVSEPLVADLVAEIVPARARTGAATDFTLVLLPRLEAGDPGFDRIWLDAPALVAGVDAVRVGGAPVDFTVVSATGEGFEISLPLIGIQRTAERVEIDFRAELFQFATLFSGHVANSALPAEIPQSLRPGDADPLVGGESLSVELKRLHPGAIFDLRLSSPSLTPNGDGVNDALQIEFELTNIAGAPVRIDIFDLAGHRRRGLGRRQGHSGAAAAVWDGRDDAGALLPPGFYLLQLAVAADSGTVRARRLVYLVY